MNAKQISLMAVATLALLTSCSSDDEMVHSNYPADNIVRITAGVDGMKTRAAYTTSNLDRFGIIINNYNNKTYSYDNISVAKDESGKWTPEQQMLWQNAETPVDIFAYAPYDPEGNMGNLFVHRFILPTTQKADATDESDLIYDKKDNFIPGEDLDDKGAIPLNFKHVLSQLIINIKFGTEFDQTEKLTSSPITGIKVSGTTNMATVNFSEPAAIPVVHAPGGATVDITPYEVPGSFKEATGNAGHEVTNAEVNYACILIPQTASGFTVSFTINDKEYSWTSTAPVELAVGTSYTLNLTVGKDVVVASGMSVKPWDTNTTDTSLNTD